MAAAAPLEGVFQTLNVRSPYNPLSTKFSGPDGTVRFEVEGVGAGLQTNIIVKREGSAIMKLQPQMFGKDKVHVTLGGATTTTLVGDIFDKGIFQSKTGEKLRWKTITAAKEEQVHHLDELSEDTQTTIAQLKIFRSSKGQQNTLELTQRGTELEDIVIISLTLAQKFNAGPAGFSSVMANGFIASSGGYLGTTRF
ncbi:hypothetical protein BKA62DRAFT_707742 [Auriculariales sp. MPI-PUGE-AT-0066]|nr:hypothetical protein BKA62DRAFT_707742 [Auriculariales sp. MPI-PUGE-AT-0066]